MNWVLANWLPLLLALGSAISGLYPTFGPLWTWITARISSGTPATGSGSSTAPDILTARLQLDGLIAFARSRGQTRTVNELKICGADLFYPVEPDPEDSETPKANSGPEGAA